MTITPELTINDLTPDVLLYLFSFLSPQDLKLVAQVSSLWNAVSSDDAIWKRFVDFKEVDRLSILNQPIGVPVILHPNAQQQPKSLKTHYRESKILNHALLLFKQALSKKTEEDPIEKLQRMEQGPFYTKSRPR